MNEIHLHLLQMKSVYDIEISPDSFESWQHPLKQMVSWAFEPAEEDILRLYIEKGRADAQVASSSPKVFAHMHLSNKTTLSI